MHNSPSDDISVIGNATDPFVVFHVSRVIVAVFGPLNPETEVPAVTARVLPNPAKAGA